MQNQRRSRAKRRVDIKTLFSNPLFAVCIVALAAVLYILINKAVTSESDYFCPGVSINEVDMSVYTKAQGEELLENWADGLMSRECRLVYNDKQWTFRPSDISARIDTETALERAWNLGHTGSRSEREEVMMTLRYSPQQFQTSFTYDEAALDTFIAHIYDEIYIAPVDADIIIAAREPVIVAESKDGLALDSDALKQFLISGMQIGLPAEYKLPVHAKAPGVSSTDAENGLQKIVEYSTSTADSSSSRTGNVRLALNNFNGFVVRPGDIVSFNETVGQRTVMRGYVEAPVYYGTSVTRGVGGGVCQASSTLYGAVLKAGMDIVERHNHNMVVGYCEASTDAAVSEDASQDFVFANNTEHTYYIFVQVDRVMATVTIFGARPEYRIELQPIITQNDIKNTAIATIKDESGKYAYYTDDLTLKSVGKLGRRSYLDRVYYDWMTGAEVKRELISNDLYQGERDTYYVGIHPVGG